MKTSITIATFLVLSAGAASAGAIQSPLQGSDTEFNITTDAIAKAGLSPLNAYVGGGSGNGETAMINGEQVIAPMSRLMNKNICSKTTTEASAVVLGLDAVDVFASITSGASPACNGAGGGLAIANTPTRWKDVLKLVYGGEPNPADPAHLMCNGPLRTALVAHWSSLFNNGCANGAAACNAAPQSGQLWHAFRRDEASGTSDVFSSLIGISPATSVSALNGFGMSPYCNAMNWDTGNGNGTTCANGKNKQFVGPGGVADTAAGDNGLHRTPPPGTWGTTPIPGGAGPDADVLPTDMQDNDPIRRKCLGTTLGTTRAAEDVCNLDGNLGLVLSIPTTDFIVKSPPIAGLVQYPVGDTSGTGAYIGCGGNSFQVKAPGILNCAPQSNRKHGGQCPDGDSGLFGGACLAKAAATGSAATGVGTQCLASPGQIPTIQVTPATVTKDGRVANMFMFDGTNGGGYIPQLLPTATGTITLDGVLGMGRIHTVSTVPPAAGVALTTCNLVDATDQIGCLVQADPCSIGYAGDGGKSWGSRKPGASVASNIDALQVDGVQPSPTTVELFGQPGEYEVARKLYLSSLIGFASVATTPLVGGAGAGSPDPNELELAEAESTPAFINPIMINDGFFNLGPSSPMGADTQYCEDFNQALLCGAASNDNACSRNVGMPIIANATGTPSAIPSDPSADPTHNTTSTICGNGKIDAFEECDPGTATQPAHGCSTTCRCVGAFVGGACN